MGSPGGYPTLGATLHSKNGMKFSARDVEEISCPICKLVLREPMQLSCGHRFCQTCLEMERLATQLYSWRNKILIQSPDLSNCAYYFPGFEIDLLFRPSFRAYYLPIYPPPAHRLAPSSIGLNEYRVCDFTQTLHPWPVSIGMPAKRSWITVFVYILVLLRPLLEVTLHPDCISRTRAKARYWIELWLCGYKYWDV